MRTPVPAPKPRERPLPQLLPLTLVRTSAQVVPKALEVLTDQCSWKGKDERRWGSDG